ncbi:hypothetical protein F2Q68_00007283 [Brassica cretica]|uniref:Uncharacterized protein n=1 Tax=Brassica cretica TaxID=69181 RepID=A0A8S9KXN4_BRACR|nr:hypothetical protein F2Q68_00007283 [Brassica cretica]
MDLAAPPDSPVSPTRDKEESEVRDEGSTGRYAKQVYDYSMSNMPTMIICVSSLLLKSGKVLTLYLAGGIQSKFYSTQHGFGRPVRNKVLLHLPNDSLALTNNDSTQWSVGTGLLVLLHLFVPSFWSVGTATSVRAKFFVLNEKITIKEIIDSTLVYKLNSLF